MTAKEYLKQYENAVRVVERVQREYDEQMEQIDSIRSALGGDGLPRSGKISKQVEKQAIRLAEKAEELMEAEVNAIEIRQEIFNMILKVPGEPGDVLQARYVNLMKWEDVADQVGYTVRHTHNLHRIGLEQIGALL